MITDKEFLKLRGIIKEEIGIETRKVVEEVLEQKLEEKLEQKLEEKLDQKLEQKLDQTITKRLRPIVKQLNKIQADLKATNHFFDNEYLGHEKRIIKIESHLNFPRSL